MLIITVILVFIYGAVIGSFLNVIILRLPKGQNINGRSHCNNCGHTLAAADLVPIVSFLFLRGRCRYCKTAISPRYAIIETLTGLLFVFTWLVIGVSGGYAILIKDMILVAVCLAVFVIDWEEYLILNRVVFPSLAIIIILNVLIDLSAHVQLWSISSVTLSGLLGAAVGSLPFYALWLFSHGRWMGFGDVKLMLLLGAAVGFPLVLLLLFVAFMLGGLVAIPLLLWGNKTMQSRVPFGTFLTVATLICIYWGLPMLHWYLAIIGI